MKPPPPLDPAEGRRQARLLVQSLLSLTPTENLSQTLELKITDRNDKERRVPVKFDVVCNPTNFLNIYQVLGTDSSAGGMKLTIVHAEDKPNEYWVNQPAETPPRRLSPDQMSLPFAGSDFWAADLGLEFLHWPQQRIIRKQMRKYVFCDVLESINPSPGSGGYSKVISWIGANRPEELVMVHAEAFDQASKLLKVFDPKKLERVNGAWQLEEMEIRNRQAGTRTRIEFNLRSSNAPGQSKK